jgi:hypothetical protein
MTEHELITLGYRYERSKGERAKALRHSFTVILNQLNNPDVRQQYIYLFNKGKEEARSRPKRV